MAQQTLFHQQQLGQVFQEAELLDPDALFKNPEKVINAVLAHMQQQQGGDVNPEEVQEQLKILSELYNFYAASSN